MLAGHSFGGLVARLYAATYPDEVVGMVLIDAAHEDYYDQVEAVLTSAQLAAATPTPDGLADDPDFEQIDIDASADRDAGGGRGLPLAPDAPGRPHPRPPLGLACRTTPSPPWRRCLGPLQEKLAALVPDSRLVVAEESGHFIPGDQPDLVIAAIQQVVEAVRDRRERDSNPHGVAPAAF